MAVAAALLALRIVAGPFHWPPISVNSPVNAGAAVAVAFVLLALMAAKNPAIASALHWSPWVDIAIAVAAIAAAFWPNLRTPFVFDDYSHIAQSSHATWRLLTDAFRPVPGGHGLFFRPVGFISYWLDYQWAGGHATRWHLWNMAAHAANTCLVYLLVKRLGMRRAAAWIAALLFALHGSRAETVAWTDARFDLLATFLVLCALLAALEYCHSRRRRLFVPLAVCAALAVYTKESAFCLPLLPIALLPCLPRAQWRRALAAALLLASVCAILFAYRWWALGGIGGYADRTGVSAVWQSRPLHTSEALLFRQWAFLFFPVNWSVPQEWWLCAAAAVFLAMLPIYAARGGACRTRLLAGLAFLLAADIPVQHLLMFQPDFAGARVLYLPLAGLAISWAALLDRPAPEKLTWAMAAALIAFNVAALEHNLRPWRSTPAAAAAVCRALGQEMTSDPRPVFVSGLPDRLDGVYFLSNGFQECVEMNSGQPAARVHVVGESAETVPPTARRFDWNRKRGQLEERR
jgi:4-amino-4-deoxy-L-arabinose transferase-like glycosyltransferase